MKCIYNLSELTKYGPMGRNLQMTMLLIIIYFLVGLGFELRASLLLTGHSTT
jgi:hypothetical protein